MSALAENRIIPGEREEEFCSLFFFGTAKKTDWQPSRVDL